MKSLKNMTLLEIDSIEIMYPPLIGSTSNVVVEPFQVSDKNKREILINDIKKGKVRSQKNNFITPRTQSKQKTYQPSRRPKVIIQYKIQLLEHDIIFRITPEIRKSTRRSTNLYKELAENKKLIYIKHLPASKRQLFRIGTSVWIASSLSKDKYKISSLIVGQRYSFRILDSQNEIIGIDK